MFFLKKKKQVEVKEHSESEAHQASDAKDSFLRKGESTFIFIWMDLHLTFLNCYQTDSPIFQIPAPFCYKH